jgi:hypothetical protein
VIDDTDPVTAEVQLDLLRRAGCERRSSLAMSLSRTVIELSRRELAARMPGATQEELNLRWVEEQYGAELAARLRAFLAARRG